MFGTGGLIRDSKDTHRWNRCHHIHPVPHHKHDDKDQHSHHDSSLPRNDTGSSVMTSMERKPTVHLPWPLCK